MDLSKKEYYTENWWESFVLQRVNKCKHKLQVKSYLAWALTSSRNFFCSAIRCSFLASWVSSSATLCWAASSFWLCSNRFCFRRSVSFPQDVCSICTSYKREMDNDREEYVINCTYSKDERDTGFLVPLYLASIWSGLIQLPNTQFMGFS